ncbi:MAG: MFS transporter [Planctomycetia bacterium]|nr:MFS transporter [Planctomycetia bacterium]
MTVDALAEQRPKDEPPLRSPEPVVPERSTAWRYYVCGLLLLATTINYLDRQALSVMSTRITSADELNLTKHQYGNLELGFGLAFAAGAIGFGWLADRTNVRWLYPTALILWSAMGYCTGHVQTYFGMLLCRTLLGVFEAGHWPCALKTTQRLLPPSQRTLGNSILQSGSSIGAAITPVLVGFLLSDEKGSWRFVFQAIALVGLGWVVLWFLALRPRDFQTTVAQPLTSTGETARGEASFFEVIFSRRFVVLLVVVAAINACWHLFRVWLPMFLEEGRGYTAPEARRFITVFYIGTDVGCIGAGFLTLWLARLGASVHRARLVTFTLCSFATSLSLFIPQLQAGWPLLGVLLLVGCGCLGLFPCYYSFTQDLSVKHQGKVTGLLGTFAWLTASPLHPLFGKHIDATKNFDVGLVFAGLCPLVAVVALWVLWSPAREAHREANNI